MLAFKVLTWKQEVEEGAYLSDAQPGNKLPVYCWPVEPTVYTANNIKSSKNNFDGKLKIMLTF